MLSPKLTTSVALFLLCLLVPVRADTRLFSSNSSRFWDVSANWNAGAIPCSGDLVVVASSAAVSLRASATASGMALTTDTYATFEPNTGILFSTHASNHTCTDPCASSPCANGGTCIASLSSYICACPTTRTGTSCDSALAVFTNTAGNGVFLDPTNWLHQSLPCSGALVDYTAESVLQQTASFERIEFGLNALLSFADDIIIILDASPCATNCTTTPCANDGTCAANSTMCFCAPGFTGQFCDDAINECASSPCHNGAVCVDTHSAFSCTCDSSWTGTLCDVNVDECASSPCSNGGSCTDSVAGFLCTCNTLYTGPTCGVKIPCLAGFTGIACESNIDECASSTCANGATCVDGINSTTCVCAANYVGAACEQTGTIVGPAGGTLSFGALAVIIPANAITANGTVVLADIVAALAVPTLPSNAVKAQQIVYSLWVPSLNGSDFARAVEIHIARDANATTVDGLVYVAAPLDSPSTWTLAESPLSTGRRRLSTCVPLSSTSSCGSTAASSAQLALLAVDECSSSPCINAGTCVNALDAFSCVCSPGFTGAQCESNIDECASSPCENDGTCAEDDANTNRYNCTCIAEVVGPQCQSDCRVETVVTSQARVDAYAGCSHIFGGLHLSGVDVRSVAPLATLGDLYGPLTINTTSVESVQVPLLRRVRGDIRVVDSPATRVVDLIMPHLAHIDGSLIAESLPSLIALDLARLQNITGDARLGNNPQLCVSAFINPAAFTAGTVDTAGSGGSAPVTCLLTALTLHKTTTSGSVAAAAAATIPLLQLTNNNTWLDDTNHTASSANTIVSMLGSVLDSLVGNDTSSGEQADLATGALTSSFAVLSNLLEPSALNTLRQSNQSSAAPELIDQFVGAASSRVSCDRSSQFTVQGRLAAQFARRQNASLVESSYTGLNETLVVPRGFVAHLGLNESCLSSRFLVSHSNPFVSTDDTQSDKVDSNIVGFSLGNLTVTDLPDEVAIDVTLQHRNESFSDDRLCVQWDRWKRQWSSSLCRAHTRHATKTVCRCKQLDSQALVRCRRCHYMTSFAILAGWNSPLATQLSETDARALSVLTYLGCVLSMVASLFIVLSYALLKKIRTQPIAMIANLAVALFAVNLIFLAGITKTQNTSVCRAVGILLYFALMASFIWMACIAHNLYFLLVKVFGQGRSLRFYFIVGWASAAVATLVITLVDVATQGGVQFGGENHCWIHSKWGLIIGFLVPIAGVLVYNLIVTVAVFYHLARTSRATDKAASDKSRVRVFFGIVACLGLTWIFAYVAIAAQQVALWYLFVIFNTLQGALLAVLFILSGRPRREWKNAIAHVRQRFSHSNEWSEGGGRASGIPDSVEACDDMTVEGGMHAGLQPKASSASASVHPDLLGRKRSIQLLSFAETMSMREPSQDAAEEGDLHSLVAGGENDYGLVDKDEDEDDEHEGYGYMGAGYSNATGSDYQGTLYGNSDGTGYLPASLVAEYGNREEPVDGDTVYGNRVEDMEEGGGAFEEDGVAMAQQSERVLLIVQSLSLKTKTRASLAQEHQRHKAVFEAMPKLVEVADDEGEYDDERHDMNALMVESQFDRSRLEFEEEIGKGNFGFVILASTKEELVAVKTLNANASQRDRDDFVREAQLLADVGAKHAGIVKLAGVCMDREPWLLVTELAMYGDLRNFVRRLFKQRHRLEVSPMELIGVAVQVASAMGFLAENGVLHCDLAARNCLVYAQNVVKVSDFGLAVRLERGHDRYKIPHGSQLPMRWMPVEALTEAVFLLEKSDVWSFGVLVWELFTFGKVRPYRDVPINGIVPFVQTGRRLELPPGCPKNVFSILKACWSAEAAERPSFVALEERLSALITRASARDLGAELLQFEQRAVLGVDATKGVVKV